MCLIQIIYLKSAYKKIHAVDNYSAKQGEVKVPVLDT